MMTNLEKLRTASLEEVAKFFNQQFFTSCPPLGSENCLDSCSGCWMKWLESPVDTSEKD